MSNILTFKPIQKKQHLTSDQKISKAVFKQVNPGFDFEECDEAGVTQSFQDLNPNLNCQLYSQDLQHYNKNYGQAKRNLIKLIKKIGTKKQTEINPEQIQQFIEISKVLTSRPNKKDPRYQLKDLQEIKPAEIIALKPVV